MRALLRRAIPRGPVWVTRIQGPHGSCGSKSAHDGLIYTKAFNILGQSLGWVRLDVALGVKGHLLVYPFGWMCKEEHWELGGGRLAGAFLGEGTEGRQACCFQHRGYVIVCVCVCLILRIGV